MVEKEHERIIAKAGIEILREIFYQCSGISNVCTVSSLHVKAKTIAQAMQLIDKAARQLTKRQEVE